MLRGAPVYIGRLAPLGPINPNTYIITATLVDQALGIHLEIWVNPGQQMMVKCSDWGCRPHHDWSQHINVRHMQGVWQPSYAVDVNMDVSLQHSCSPCWQSFGNSRVTPGQQMMMKCGDWGCRPNQDWSQHINVRHMQGVWQPSYAVDVNMDAS